jgi:hypothetical protein
MEPLIPMNKFEIIDMPGMTTLAFVVEKTENVYADNRPMLSLQKIDSIDSTDNGRIKKTFNVLKENDDPQLIVLLTLTNTKAILSTGELTQNGFKATESNIPLSYGSIYNNEGIEYKEVDYTPNMKRHFSIIDTQTGEEIKPVLYNDEITGKVKGKCKLLPHRPYIVLELKFEDE